MLHSWKSGRSFDFAARQTKTIAGALLACVANFGAMPASVAAPDYAKMVADIYAKNPPIVFFVAKGAAGACGPGCDSWIAAEGRFDDGAAARLRQLFGQIGKRKLPIFFNSIGGETTQALAIGRMLRARGMTAGVARTLMAHCVPAKSISECGKAILANPNSEAALSPAGGFCASACAYALIGASTRLVAPIALVGVHTGPTYFKHYPRGFSERQRERADENLQRQRAREHEHYIAEMSIKSALFTIIDQTPFEKTHYLTRAELFDLGIDRREDLLVGWNVGVFEQASIGYAAYLTIAPHVAPESAQSASPQPKPLTLALSCRPGGYLLTSVRPLPDASARPTSDLLITAGFTKVLLDAKSSFLTSHQGETLEIRQFKVWRDSSTIYSRRPRLRFWRRRPRPRPARKRAPRLRRRTRRGSTEFSTRGVPTCARR